MSDAPAVSSHRPLARPQRCGIVPTLAFWTGPVVERLSLALLVPQLFLAAPLALVALGLRVPLALPLLLGVLAPLLLMGLCERRLRRTLARHRAALAAAWHTAPDGRPPLQPRVVVRLRGAVHTPPAGPPSSRPPLPAPAPELGPIVAWLFEPVLPDLWLAGLRALAGACALLIAAACLDAGPIPAALAIAAATLLPGVAQLVALRGTPTGPFPGAPEPPPLAPGAACSQAPAVIAPLPSRRRVAAARTAQARARRPPVTRPRVVRAARACAR